jgi:hypothetical protein
MLRFLAPAVLLIVQASSAPGVPKVPPMRRLRNSPRLFFRCFSAPPAFGWALEATTGSLKMKPSGPIARGTGRLLLRHDAGRAQSHANRFIF